MLLLWLPLKQRPGLGTLSNVLTIGVVVDAVMALTTAPHGLPVRVLLMIAGVTLNGVATGACIGAALGPGPRDGLMIGLAARGCPIRVVRTCIEFVVFAAGFLLGGTVGIGTLTYALARGPSHTCSSLCSVLSRGFGRSQNRRAQKGSRLSRLLATRSHE